MTVIVSGTFADVSAVDRALAHLAGAGIPASETHQSFLDASAATTAEIERIDDAQKDVADEQATASGAASGAAAGAAVGVVVGAAVGLVTLPFLGPIAPVAAAGVGAYVGSLGGALASMPDDNDNKPQAISVLPATPECLGHSIVLAVATSSAGQQEVACDILRSHGATSIIWGEGTLAGGMDADENGNVPTTTDFSRPVIVAAGTMACFGG